MGSCSGYVRQIQAILFDMDGLMFDTEYIGLLGWQAAAEALDITIPQTLITQMRGTGEAECRKQFNKLIPGLHYDEAHRIRMIFADEYITQHGIPVKHGLYKLLQYLKSQNIPAALATSTARDKALSYLEMADIQDAFTVTVFGSDVSPAKPAPDIFLTAAKLLNVSCENCLVLEDSPNGLLAAKRAGMQAIFIPDLCPDPGPEYYTAKKESLTNVIDYLERIRK